MKEGNHWRAYYFIPKARTFDAVENTEQAFQAARAFGRFQEMLAGLPAPRLHDTIPDFHNTPRRFNALLEAISANTAGRAIRWQNLKSSSLSRTKLSSMCCLTRTCRSA